jgi:hypothetical protein
MFIIHLVNLVNPVYLFINAFDGKLGFNTFSALSTPATGNRDASIKPSWANTDAWSQ